MPRVSYVNGQFVPHGQAAVHVEDRGYQFSDGVYEVWGVSAGRPVDMELHLDRLERSLGELRIAMPMSRQVVSMLVGEMIRRNRIRNGLVYLQITRGVAPRDHAFPAKPVAPSVVMTAKPIAPSYYAPKVEKGIKIITVPDIRWARPDIKSVSLLGNVLAIQAARDAGADDAWQVDREGFITEGSRSNAWIVDAEGNLVTRKADNAILNGITRRVIISIAEREGRKIIERPFTPEEAKGAREAFQTSASAYVIPVVEIDGQPVANGAPGSVALAVREFYLKNAASA
jgi:D-alanine transaminase